MTSSRHIKLEQSIEQGRDPEGYLDAARESIFAVGWRRTTLTDIARRAGVSRMTIYRRWDDMQTLLADLLVREWDTVLRDALDRARLDPTGAIPRPLVGPGAGATGAMGATGATYAPTTQTAGSGAPTGPTHPQPVPVPVTPAPRTTPGYR